MTKPAEDGRREHRVGVFSTRGAAEAAFAALVRAGFAPDQISLFVPVPEDDGRSQEAGQDSAIDRGGEAGATVGAGAGALGATLARAGLLAIPGVGTFLGIGPIAAALSGALAGVAIGGFIGSLIGLGVAEGEAAASERHMKQGRAVLIVDCGMRGELAARVMREAGAS